MTELCTPPVAPKRQRRKERRLRDADLRVGARGAALGGGDVRPPLEQLGRQRRPGSAGRRSASGCGAIESSAGGLPISTAIACSSCARATVRVEHLRLRRLELRFGLRDVAARDDAGRVLVLRELQRALVARRPCRAAARSARPARAAGDSSARAAPAATASRRRGRRRSPARSRSLASTPRRMPPHRSISQLASSATL